MIDQTQRDILDRCIDTSLDVSHLNRGYTWT